MKPKTKSLAKEQRAEIEWERQMIAKTRKALANCHQQDRMKTSEINILVKENRELSKALRSWTNPSGPKKGK